MSETQRVGTPIEFWFDFASGYAYFAALEIEALAERHSRTVAWRPFTLGAAFKVTGAQGLSRTPLKRDYARRDWQRLARTVSIPTIPTPSPPSGSTRTSSWRALPIPRSRSSRASKASRRSPAACSARLGSSSTASLFWGSDRLPMVERWLEVRW